MKLFCTKDMSVVKCCQQNVSCRVTKWYNWEKISKIWIWIHLWYIVC